MGFARRSSGQPVIGEHGLEVGKNAAVKSESAATDAAAFTPESTERSRIHCNANAKSTRAAGLPPRRELPPPNAPGASRPMRPTPTCRRARSGHDFRDRRLGCEWGCGRRDERDDGADAIAAEDFQACATAARSSRLQ
jgi:hypothetical protein